MKKVINSKNQYTVNILFHLFLGFIRHIPSVPTYQCMYLYRNVNCSLLDLLQDWFHFIKFAQIRR